MRSPQHADHASANSVAAFVSRWSGSGGAERANCQPFLSELCDLLGVARPAAQSGGLGAYRFERSVPRPEPDGRTSTRFIDLYKQGCFILEAKQGAAAAQPSLFGPEPERRATVRNTSGWAQHMLAARGQAERYVRDIPPAEGNPPFLIVCDVGFCFDLYADFSGLGKHYSQFPDASSFRVYLTELHDPARLALLRTIWTEPHALDPSRRRVEVTREIAAFLAKLAVALEARHAPDSVATFLMRCIFCMFAQSVVELAPITGTINADLTVGADASNAVPLRGNAEISSRGTSLRGAGFIVLPALARGLGLGRVAGLGRIVGLERHIRPYLNGRDLTQRSRGVMVIDLDGVSETEVRKQYPDAYQHVLVHVKPERDQNNEPYRRMNWWLFGRNNSLLRAALRALPCYIATVETAKHRMFCFLPAAVIPDNVLVCIASDSAPRARVEDMLQALVAMGQAHQAQDGSYYS